MKTLFRSTFLVLTLATLLFSAFPFQSASAAGLNEGPAADPQHAGVRLEWAFARLKISVERIGLNVQYSDPLVTRAEELIAKAKENGKDVAAVEAALKAYKEALAKGKPLYEKAKSLVESHAGFDANGKVTNTETAKQTVKDLGEVVKQYRETVGPAAKALGEALKAYRQANPRPTVTPKP